MVVLFTESGKKGVGRTIGKNGFSLVNLTLRDLWDVPIGHWIHTSAVRYTDLRIDPFLEWRLCVLKRKYHE